MDESLNVAVVGAGRMGAFHVEAWECTRATQLIAVAEPDEHLAYKCIGRRPIAWYHDWQDLIQRADLDAISVASPTELHAEVAIAALESGKHVLVEKPIAATIQDARRVEETARSTGGKLMVGHVERFNPAVTKISELLAAGRLGRIYRAQATRVGPMPLRVQDVGVALDLATHDVDVMQHVLRQPITHAYAQGGQFSHPAHEDMLTCLLTFGDDGPFGLLDINWLTPEKRRELTIIGEGGMLHASYLTQDVWFTESATMPTGWTELARVRGDAEGSQLRFGLRKLEPLRAEIASFASCIRDDSPEPVSAEAGTRALAIALAIRQSVSTREPVDVEHVLAEAVG